jgi:hypothetical protein
MSERFDLTADRLLHALPADGAYAIVDAARGSEVRALVQAAGAEALCLYDGRLTPSLAAAAPYLVRVRRGGLLRPLLEAAFRAQAWGVFLASTATPQRLRRHLRRLLLVRGPDAKDLYFRFYDPRVLRVYLPTCTPEELAAFFGPATLYFTEERYGDGLVEWWRDGESLGQAPALRRLGRPPDTAEPLVVSAVAPLLTMREPQMAAFQAELDWKLAERLRAHVQERLGRRLDGDEGLAQLHAALGRARRHRVTSAESLAEFAVLSFERGAGFDEDPAVQRHLSDSTTTPDLAVLTLRFAR